MGITTAAEEKIISPEGNHTTFENTHKVINALVVALQDNYKANSKYDRPLLPPLANILFALDGEVAKQMVTYMTGLLRDVGGFEESEFRFILKGGNGTTALQRIRLEFQEGVTTEVAWKITKAVEMLEKHCPSKRN